MKNLVWDESRIPELREIVERSIIDYLESFSNYNSNDAYHVAVRVGKSLEVEMENIELKAHVLCSICGNKIYESDFFVCDYCDYCNEHFCSQECTIAHLRETYRRISRCSASKVPRKVVIETEK